MDLQSIIDSIVKLPPSPQILPKLQTLLRDVDAGIHDIISLLKVDAPMTAQIVRLSNSAYFGASSPSQSLEEAVTRLGFREVYKVVSMAAANQVLGDAVPVYNMGKGQLLQHSIACAVVMVECSARRLSGNLDSAYTIGLLHSLGKVIINQYYLKHGLEIYSSDGGEDLDVEMERKILGFDYAEAGAAILRKWNFPAEIYEPIEYQYNPTMAPDHSTFASMLAIARWGADFLVQDKGNDSPIPIYDGNPTYLELTGLAFDELNDCMCNAREGLKELDELVR
ncbi:MAG: HDOD domain-containing protein [Opitutales bacterium]|nr:HDOD domain-containing protein [Opitutales bacterium]